MSQRKVLVTGGGGFLGGAIAKRLLQRGDDVHTFQRQRYPELDQLGASTHQGDLRDREAIGTAVSGCDVVFHVAAKVGVWGRYRDYYSINVEGTRSVIDACRAAGVPRLVFTSSPSVVFDGGDGEGVDESKPYPKRFLSYYPQTKAAAEQLVLAENSDQLATVSLRPHLIWGPGDPHLAPRIIARARAGRLRFVGSGDNLVDITYIDNAVDAHLAAADVLANGRECAGKPYFISDGDPRPLRELTNRILAAAEEPPVSRSISPGLAYAVGGTLEAIYRSLRLDAEPLITRFVVRELATAHWFDLTAARRDLGYQPNVSLDEGMQLLAESLHG